MQRKPFLAILKSLCLATTGGVFDSAKQCGFSLHKCRKQRYAFRPGASPTSPLIVCHADTVVNGGNGPHNYSYDAKSGIVKSIALDDRLGIACMFDAIFNTRLMATCAMLICDDEEIGQSSAQVFDRKIKPDFLVELDRRGTDVVCYDYESVLFSSLLESCGFTVGSGSFSDICYLTDYGVCGVNVGVGYRREHSLECHANLADTFAQLKRLDCFLTRFSGVRLEWDQASAFDRWSKPSKYSSWDYYSDDLPPVKHSPNPDNLRADDFWAD